ncbi:hypothetical protein LCGC14_1493790, partial [marine sediment metagenome]
MITRERIMLGGESKAGKTFAWLSIARSNPGSQFFVAEPDDGISKVLELEYKDVLEQKNVHGAHKSPDGLWLPPEFISNWRDVRHFVSGMKSLRDEGQLKPDDWIVLEGMDIITRIIRSEYIAETNKVDSKTKEIMEDPWQAILTKRARGAPVLEPSDHDAINYEYEGQMTTLVYTMPCNFLSTSGIERIHFDSKFVDTSQKEYYASLGTPFKLEGHKRNPRMFDTLVYLYVGTEYQMEVLGDRGRGKQARRKCTDFWLELERSRTAMQAAAEATP